jgi:uncharacterized membrane protein
MKEFPVDLSTILKFIHVLAAVVWVGGGFAIIVTVLLLARRSPAETQLTVIRATIQIGPPLFLPASLITLASGLALVFAAGWGWQPFTVLGLVGIVFTACFGALFLGPASERALKLEATEGAEAALPHLHRLLRLALMDYVIQFAIVFLMVTKPGWDDLFVFVGLAAVIGAVVITTLRSLPRPA